MATRKYLDGRHFFRLVDVENRQTVKKQMGKWKVEPRPPFAKFVIHIFLFFTFIVNLHFCLLSFVYSAFVFFFFNFLFFLNFKIFNSYMHSLLVSKHFARFKAFIKRNMHVEKLTNITAQ